MNNNKLSKEELKTLGALGYREDMNAEQLAGKHVDSITGLVFATEEQYLDHVSPETGHTPREIEHQDVLTDGAFSKQAESAINRGAEKSE